MEGKLMESESSNQTTNNPSNRLENNRHRWAFNPNIGTFLISLFGIFVAAGSAFLGYEIKQNELESTKQLKQIETLHDRGEAYVAFFDSMGKSFAEMQAGNKDDLWKSYPSLESSFLKMEPYLSKSARDSAWAKVDDMEVFLQDNVIFYHSHKLKGHNPAREYVLRREQMKEFLHRLLFPLTH